MTACPYQWYSSLRAHPVSRCPWSRLVRSYPAGSSRTYFFRSAKFFPQFWLFCSLLLLLHLPIEIGCCVVLTTFCCSVSSKHWVVLFYELQARYASLLCSGFPRLFLTLGVATPDKCCFVGLLLFPACTRWLGHSFSWYAVCWPLCVALTLQL